MRLEERKKIKRIFSPAGKEKEDKIRHLLTFNVKDAIVYDSLLKKLKSGRQLRIKLGADPTAPHIHLGHAVVLWKLREFQDLGHKVIFIIGDTTAQIGDPSGKSKVRPRLSKKEIKRNAETYFKQAGCIINIKDAEIHYNSKWFSKMSLFDLVQLATNFTVAHLTERDDFRSRLRSGKDLHLHELLYPVLQAYDSIITNADIEIGGTDQLFNMLAGRELQRKLGKKEQDIITLPLLVGTDGKEKMSKSLGNFIGITDHPLQMFAKLMSIPDETIEAYAQLAAQWDKAQIKALRLRLKSKENPRDIKADVAEAIVRLYAGANRAKSAREEFQRVFSHKELPRKIPLVTVRRGKWNAVELLLTLKIVKSKSAARRLIDQGGVRIGEEKLTSWKEPVVINSGLLLQIGKHKFIRIK